ncbi:MAG: helix-turn-helix transcriptional regulator [Prolixibacteraceae bacterium]|nr:helix-turn-helix transcriptional regulator [Prolixibacteraceae bacterium]
MVASKTELFNEVLRERAKLFKLLAHPARLQILQYLSSTQSCISGDISEELPLGRTTVNQHLKELKDAGLIIGTVEGVKTNYCLDCCLIDKKLKILDDFLKELKEHSHSCCS